MRWQAALQAAYRGAERAYDADCFYSHTVAYCDALRRRDAAAARTEVGTAPHSSTASKRKRWHEAGACAAASSQLEEDAFLTCHTRRRSDLEAQRRNRVVVTGVRAQAAAEAKGEIRRLARAKAARAVAARAVAARAEEKAAEATRVAPTPLAAVGRAAADTSSSSSAAAAADGAMDATAQSFGGAAVRCRARARRGYGARDGGAMWGEGCA